MSIQVCVMGFFLLKPRKNFLDPRLIHVHIHVGICFSFLLGEGGGRRRSFFQYFPILNNIINLDEHFYVRNYVSYRNVS